MLPFDEPKYDNFQEIVEKAQERISRLYPAWTNFNPADSGMALLELFAYMTELQQFHLEQLGKPHLQALLYLLGTQPEGMQSARVYGRAEGFGRGKWLLKGTKLTVGSLVFELDQTRYLEKEGVLVQKPQLPFYPFGEEPLFNNTWEIKLCLGLKAGVVHTLYFCLADDYPVSRNAIEDGDNFIPLINLDIEYFDGTRYQSCEILEDTTYGLLQTGVISFCFSESGNKNECRLKITAAGEYDTAPIIKDICFNMLPLVQRDTVLECQGLQTSDTGQDFYEFETDSWYAVNGSVRVYIRQPEGYRETERYSSYLCGEKRRFVIAKEMFQEGEKAMISLVSGEPGAESRLPEYYGTGLPYQKYFLPEQGILGSAFSLWVEESPGSDCYLPWQQVCDLAQAGYRDRCYVLDEEKGIISFGNGEQGVMPVGRIKVTGYVLCAGEKGNIQTGQSMKLKGEFFDGQIYNTASAKGGKRRESIEDCLNRYERSREIKKRAVTCEDYEELIKGTQGLRIKQAKVFPLGTAENSLGIVFSPYTNGNRHLTGDAYDRNILHLLEETKMIGTQIVIKKAEYIRVILDLEVMVKNRNQKTETGLEEAIRDYFDCNMDFGDTIIYSHIFGFIDSLPMIEGISDLTIHANGRGILRDENKDIHLPFHGLAYLEKLEIRYILTDRG